MTLPRMQAEMTGAFFDLDNTLLPPRSLEWRFIGYLLERDQISSAHVGGWLARFAANFWRDPHGATAGNKSYLRGLREALVDEWEKSLGPEFSCRDSLVFFDEGVQQVAWHGAQSHRVFLVSGTLAPLARMAARNLSELVSAEIEVCATELEVAPGLLRMWNGRIAGEHVRGGAKSRAVRMLAARHGLDLSRSYAYGDSAGDREMLEAVGHGIAVNPTRHLARVARKRGWKTCVWEKALGGTAIVPARRLSSQAARW
jgi:HAD superfamily phosphoserine phosphatase-like hydrolase